MRIPRWVAVVSVMLQGVIFSGNIAMAGDGGKKPDLDGLPAVVRAAIEEAANGGAVKKIERKYNHGTAVYEVDYVIDGDKKEVQVAEDGTIVKTMEKTSISKVPAVVKAAIEQATSGGSVSEIQKKQAHGNVVYEVDYVKDGDKKEVQVAEDGSIVKTKEKTTIEKVSPGAKTAIERSLGSSGGEVKRIEMEQNDGNVVYKIAVVKEWEIVVAEDGTILTSTNQDDSAQ